MEKEIRIYNLHDPQQYKDEKAYWKSKTPQERLHALEMIRKSVAKLSNKNEGENGDEQRLRRVIRIIKRS